MTETKQLVEALSQGLKARLAFREQPLADAVQEVARKASMTQNRGSLSARLAVAHPFIHEARERAELVSNYLKQARMSWSARQLVEAERELRSSVMELFEQNLSEAEKLVARIGGIIREPEDKEVLGCASDQG